VTDNQTERVEELGFDRLLQRLRAVVSLLETGNLSLEDSLRVYEEGVGLARRGHELLDGAEKRVELLVREGREGVTAVPLEPPPERGAEPGHEAGPEAGPGPGNDGED
jgi:exodeoxyribonuclease VII small subunit